MSLDQTETINDRGTDRRRTLMTGAFLLLAVTMMIYWPAFQGGFLWDDDNYVANNQTLRDLDGLRDIWLTPQAIPQYYPLVHTTFWLEYQIWELDPFGYHVVNGLCHAVTALLLWAVLAFLKVPAAAFITIIFACHPVHVESVAWITERKNVLSGVFYMASLLCYLKYASPCSESSAHRRKRFSLYAASLLLFACALLSKTVTCTLPVVCLIILWWRGDRITPRTILSAVPFLILGFVMGMLTVHLEKYDVGAQGAEWSYGLLERCMIAGKVLWFYVGKLLWPTELIFVYPRWEISLQNWLDFLYPISFLGIAILLFIKRRQLGRAPVAAVAVYAVTLFPALGFFNVYPMRYSFVADHFQYLASVPVIAITVAGLASLMLKISKQLAQDKTGANSSMTARPQLVVFVSITAVLCALTWFRCHAFQTIEGLWLDTIRKNPSAWIGHNNLGLIYMNRGLLSEASERFQTAISLKPNHARAYNNLAMALAQEGRAAEAEAQFRKSLELKPNDPRVLNNFGTFLNDQGRKDEAKACYNAALEINPRVAGVLINLGNIHAGAGDYDQASDYFNDAIRIDPANAEARYNNGNLLLQQGRLEPALKEFTEAIKAGNDFHEATYQAGIILQQLGRDAEAAQHFLSIITVEPGHFMAQFQLGYIAQKHGNIEAASQYYFNTIKTRPEFAEAHNNLGTMYEVRGQRAEALAGYAEAIRLNPNYTAARENLDRLSGSDGE